MSNYRLLEDNLKYGTVAVVIPCFKVKKQILSVIAGIGAEVDTIYVVDDACPEKTGEFVESECDDNRVKILIHQENQGVGGAVMTGYAEALADGATVIVKIDGDGQMDSTLIPKFIRPIQDNLADYTKGNRFYKIESLQSMPFIRLIGNSALSFMTKFSSGYWNIFDPTNGYTAINSAVLKHLPFDKIDRRYFFESDMLFRLNTLRAFVLDIPMRSHYADETSSLRIHAIIFDFMFNHIRNCSKRLLYSYYLRDFNIASLHFIIGCISLLFGTVFGVKMWINSINTGVAATSGTVMLAALPTLTGIQFLLAFLAFDVANVPKNPISSRL